jgi:hypothetical protein
MTQQRQLFSIQWGSKSVNQSKYLNPYLTPKQYFLIQHTMCMRSRDSSVGIATGYVLDDRGVAVRVPVGQESSPSRPDRLWSPPNFLHNGYRVLFPRGKVAGA